MTSEHFPLLSKNEFDVACLTIKEKGVWPAGSEVTLHFNESGDGHVQKMSIKRALEYEFIKTEEELAEDALHGQDEADFQDGHDEELVSKIPSGKAIIVYDVLLSPVYEVPVLYFTLENLSVCGRATIEEIYDQLVPTEFRMDVGAVSIIGAVSYADHPLTGLPSLMVQPCKTADVMRELARDKVVKLEDYLMRWIGVVGAVVKLSVRSRSEEEKPELWGEIELNLG